MKRQSYPFLRVSAIAIAVSLSSAHSADIILGTGTYTDNQSYNNGTINGPVTFGSGANYTFDSLNLPLAWNRAILNSGASLNVGGNISVDFSGVSLNGGTLTAGGLLLHDAPNWAGNINDGKQSIEQGESIINGATIIANQSNSNFISFIGSTSTPVWDVHLANNLWIGNDGATINSNGHNIGITMALGNFSVQSGSLTKTGAGTLTLSTNNSYSGGTTVNGGVLEVSGSSAGNSYIRGTVTVNSGAELRYTGGDGTGFGFNGGNKLDTIHINGGLLNSQGTMTHIWNATVNMSGGELRVNGGTSSGTGDRIEWNNTTVNTAASSDTASITGRINFRADSSNVAVFNVADGAAATDLLVSAAVTQSAAVGITKNGAGTMELSGSNSYTGATTVTAGTLVVNGNISTSSLATVNSGATLQGSGTVGATTINGILNPGNSIGTINVLGTLELNGIANFEIDPTLGIGLDRAADLASVTGAISYGGILNVLYGGDASNFTNGMTFNLFDATLGFSDQFTSINLPSLAGGLTWQNDLVTSGSITVVPEPSTGLLGGLGLLALLRRRNRR